MLQRPARLWKAIELGGKIQTAKKKLSWKASHLGREIGKILSSQKYTPFRFDLWVFANLKQRRFEISDLAADLKPIESLKGQKFHFSLKDFLKTCFLKESKQFSLFSVKRSRYYSFLYNLPIWKRREYDILPIVLVPEYLVLKIKTWNLISSGSCQGRHQRRATEHHKSYCNILLLSPVYN